MSRKTSRALALGLLTSSLVVMGLELWAPDQIESTQARSSDSLVETVSELEEKIAELATENTRLNDEVDRLSEGYANNFKVSDLKDESETTEEDVDVDEDEADESESSEEKILDYTITVKDGEPSSVVAKQLESFGLIEDRHAFDRFLEENNYAKKVRPGNYVVTTDMNESELAEAIIK